MLGARIHRLVTRMSGARQRADEAERRLALEAELRVRESERIRLHEVQASRARVLEAADRERRRLVRDLHEGAQQRLVHTVVMLKLARQRLDAADAPALELIDDALAQAQRATDDLRELAHGILPALLSHGGLRAGVDSLASRMPLPVSIDVPATRFPGAAEATAYFVIAEALANVAKHAHAQHARVTVVEHDARLEVEVRDDGVGGALPGGSGLLGMEDRLAALEGDFAVDSPAGAGTLIAASIPLPDSAPSVAHVRQYGEDPAMLGSGRADA